MPQLPFEEKVELRADMRLDAMGVGRADGSVWMPYQIIQIAQKSSLPFIVGPDGIDHMDRVLLVMPIRPDLRPADVFLSYSNKDGGLIENPAYELERMRILNWWDRGLIAGQAYRDVLQRRIETVKAVVVLWTENSIGSKWVKAEADLADHHGKLICLRDPNLDPKHFRCRFRRTTTSLSWATSPAF